MPNARPTIVDNAPHATVTHVVARENPSVAIAVQDSTFSVVTDVTVVGYGYEGVYLQTDGSSLTNSTVSAPWNPAGVGVVVWGDEDIVSGNTFLASSKQGVQVQYGGGDQVTKNSVQGSGDDGIRLYDAQLATVSGNTVTGSAADGVVVRNTSDGTTLTKNTVSANAADGIEVSNDSLGSLITGNVATGNRSSGIDVENTSPSSKLGKNTAGFNGIYGVVGAVGVIDLGGNHGSDNGQTDCDIGGAPCA